MIHKKYLLILVVLLAVIGLVGAGCLGSDNDDNATNGTNNSTGNTTNGTSNTSNASNTSNTSNMSNTSNTSATSSLPDVVYANQGSGGGGGSRSSSSPTISAVLNISADELDLPLYVTDEPDAELPDLVQVEIYVPSANLAGNTIKLTMTGTISEDLELLDGGILIDEDATAKSGKVATIVFKDPISSLPAAPSLNVTVGKIVYQVTFIENAYFVAVLGSNGTMTITDEIGDLSVTKSGVCVTELGDVTFSFTPKTSYVRSDFILMDWDETPITYTPTGYSYTASVTSQIYIVSVSFEQKATGMVGGTSGWYIDQNMVAENNIFLYIPASAIVTAGDDITVSIPGVTLTGATIDSGDGTATFDGNTVTITLTNADNLENGGIGAPGRVTVTAATDDETYSIYLLKSAKVAFTFGSDSADVTYKGETESVTGSLSAVLDLGEITLVPADGRYVMYAVDEGVASYVDGDGSGDITLTDNYYVFTITDEEPML